MTWEVDINMSDQKEMKKGSENMNIFQNKWKSWTESSKYININYYGIKIFMWNIGFYKGYKYYNKAYYFMVDTNILQIVVVWQYMK